MKKEPTKNEARGTAARTTRTGWKGLSAREERVLAVRAQRGDAAARDELARRHQPLVRSFALRQSRGTLPLDELIQEGNLGLLRAIEKFDPAAGTRFASYALWWVRAYVWRYLRGARSSVRQRADTTVAADASLDAPLADDGDATWLDRLVDERPGADSRFADAEGGAQVRSALERVRARVGDIGWDVIHSRLSQDPPDTLEQIGRRWGVSRERVRQIEVATKRFLRGVLRPVQEREAA